MCFGKVGSCCSTSDRRRVNHVLVGPITNTSWVRAQLCKLEKRMHSTRSRKCYSLPVAFPWSVVLSRYSGFFYH